MQVPLCKFGQPTIGMIASLGKGQIATFIRIRFLDVPDQRPQFAALRHHRLQESPKILFGLRRKGCRKGQPEMGFRSGATLKTMSTKKCLATMNLRKLVLLRVCICPFFLLLQALCASIHAFEAAPQLPLWFTCGLRATVNPLSNNNCYGYCCCYYC